MKKQASLNLLITDNTAEKKALDGHLMLVATESGFKSIDSTGSEAEIGGGSQVFGDWIPFEPTGQVVLWHNFNDAFAPGILQLRSGNKIYDMGNRVSYNTNDITIDFTGLELTGEHWARFAGSKLAMAEITMPDGAIATYENYSGDTWSDTSGNSKDLVKSGTVTQEGGAAVFTDNTGKLTCNSGFGLSSQATVCMVVSIPEGNTNWFACELGLLGVYESTLTFGNNNHEYTASADISTILQPNKPVSIILTINGNNINYYVNNVKLDLGEIDNWSKSAESALGNVYQDNYSFAGGKIFQCVIYDSVLTESVIERCYSYAKKTYSIG